MPGLTLGDAVPNLEVETTHGKMKLHDYFSGSWTVLFSHPGDFTPVCTTELAKMASYSNEFEKRCVKLLGLSCDDISSHKEWTKDVEAFAGDARVTYPIIADPNREILKELNMIDADEKDSSGRHMPSRALHIVGPDKTIKLSFLYPACTGRNMEEVLRVLDSLQRACKHKIATPVNWKLGEPVVVSPSVDNEQAKELFPQGFKTVDLPSKKGYLRFTNVD
ncbi:hypothetical protein MLD38_035993 [Melastoma candidum]|uniref:Uncharacterized protein n=1 Tax=Melastoma candidum TaxID=119954 RepID=A0ACB9LHP3_9MYRT|nr:hypothetical protein MLD38_035993 [Melastoma candidum]